MRGLERALRKQNAVVAEDADGNAVTVCEAGDEGRAVERLELVELRAVDQPRDDLAHVELLLEVDRNNSVELARVVFRLDCPNQRYGVRLLRVQVSNDAAAAFERMAIVLGIVIGHAGFFRVYVGATEIFGRNDFAGRR